MRLLRALGRAFVPAVAVLLLSTASQNTAWAQNENESTGFRTNHVFEGSDGDNIDLLSGGLTLTIPIGPKYQVNDRLSYQLQLAYNSKVWDYSEWSDSGGAIHESAAKLRNFGPMGVGFTLNLGRIVQDKRWGVCPYPDAAYTRIANTWSWITPDGGSHDIRWSSECPSATTISDTTMMTTDQTYAQVSRTSNAFTIKTTDGLLYTLAQHIADYDVQPQNNSLRADNFSFGGWYVTKIEDPSIPAATRPTVTVTYESDTDHPNYAHVISRIQDSHGRVISFHNGVIVGGACVEYAAAASRRDVVTCSIEVPSFAGVESVGGAVATYQFKYQVVTVDRAYPTSTSNTIANVPQLIRIDYPTYTDRSSTAHVYSTYFGYNDGGRYTAEMTCRTLPVERDTSRTCETFQGLSGEISYRYTYNYYLYQGVYISGGQDRSYSVGPGYDDPPPSNQSQLPPTHVPGRVVHVFGNHLSAETGYGRVVSEKRMYGPEPATPGPLVQHAWTYVRPSTPASNPLQVTVTDGFGNDTVYYFRGSFGPVTNANVPDGTPIGEGADDGIAPEWDDGLNYRTEYYRGTGGARVLLRWEEKEYDGDRNQSGQNLKYNTRLRRTRTVYAGVTPIESIVTSSDWDDIGHWRTESKTGSDVDGVVTRRTAYVAKLSPVYVTGLANHQEVNDGTRVLARIDNAYDANGRLTTSISRKNVPAAIDLQTYLTSASGDVKTIYVYDPASGALTSKSLTSKGDGSTYDYCMDYTWLRGAYLKTKVFKDCATSVPLPWKAIDRLRDGNTGSIYSTKDPAGFETLLAYDRMGRLTDIDPPGTEYPTTVDFPSLRMTTVRRGTSATDYEFTRYNYDALGRLVCEERRPADSAANYPYQATRYDIDGRVLFKSEWLPGGATSCSTTTTQGTTFNYGTPSDPFGRVMTTTTADQKITNTSYDGLDTIVTVQGVAGSGGATRNVTTRYTRDGWNRLIMVDPPADGGAQAAYRYDLRDNLIQVDLFARSDLSPQTRIFEYDALGRLYFATNPENGTVVNTAYDALGNVVSTTDASGTVFSYEYDAADRPRKFLRAGYLGPLAEYIYDEAANGAGKVSRIISGSDTGGWRLTKSLNYAGPNGRLSSADYLVGGWPGSGSLAVGYTYDSFGNVSGITYPGGSSLPGSLAVNYQYSNGKVVSVRDASTNVVLGAVTYGNAGNILSLTTPGGGKSDIAPDTRNRPSRIKIGGLNASNVFQEDRDFDSQTYVYDGAGNISAIGSDLYRYDASNRLIEAVIQGQSEIYTQCFGYDDFGNIRSIVDDVGATPTVCAPASGPPPTPDALFSTTNLPANPFTTNRILNGTIGAQSGGFFYDPNGNLVTDLRMKYRYDVRNRLANVARMMNPAHPENASVEVGRYEYDADNHRLWKTDILKDLGTLSIRGEDGLLLSEYRKTAFGDYVPEWVRDHVYLAGRLVSVRENRRPQPPGGLSASIQRNDTVQPAVSTVTLRWYRNPAEDGVTYYQVYRATTGAMVAYAQASTNCTGETNRICFSDLAVPASTSVSYQIAAVSPAGTSYASDGLTFLAGDNVAPTTPTCLRGTAGDTSVVLSWNPSTSGDVLGYNIYRQAASDPSPLKLNAYPVGEVGFTDTGLTNFTSYSYWVKAVDNVGNESGNVNNTSCNPTLPAVFSAMPKDYAPPAPPHDLMVAGDCNAGSTATLTWEPNAGTDYVARYRVYRVPDFSPPGPRDAGLDAQGHPNTTYVDTGLAAVTSYYYWVVAEDATTPTPNYSSPSQRVGVTTKQQSTLLAVPPGKLMLQAGNGQVRVRFVIPPTASNKNIATFSIYRKLNVELSCGDFQRVGQVFASGKLCHGTQTGCTSSYSGCTCDEYSWSGTTRDFIDGTVPNNLAWDYALTSVASSGAESGFSETAYAIPLAPPENYRECLVEPCGQNYILCNGPYYDRCVEARWNPPIAPVYQPTPSTPDPGALSYLVGYRSQQYLLPQESDSWNDVTSVVTTVHPNEDIGTKACSLTGTQCANSSTCQTQVLNHLTQACVEMATCKVVTTVSCNSNNQCPTGTTCTDGACAVGVQFCQEKGDCPSIAECVETDSRNAPDPYRLPSPDPWMRRTESPLPLTPACQSIIATYKVYVDGNWLTAQSQPTANFSGMDLGGNESVAMARCPAPDIDMCNVTPSTPRCQATSEPPQITAAPVAMNNQQDPNRIDVTWQAPSNPADLARVAGYNIHVQERTGGWLQVTPYGHSRRTPWVTVGAGTTSYSFMNLPRYGRSYNTVISYEFVVTTFDAEGKVSQASPASNGVTVPYATTNTVVPVALKQVPWTLSDSGRDDGTISYPSGTANPRTLDGIKLQWRSNGIFAGGGALGFRVLRATDRGGPYCALLKSGPNNPSGLTICADNNAYSDSLTRSLSEPGNRMFHLDLSVLSDTSYYYKVVTVGATGNPAAVSGESNIIEAVRLPRATGVPSPPRHLKAWGPLVKDAQNNYVPGRNVYLKWCPNPTQENVTAYRIYRSRTQGGPYYKIVEIDNATTTAADREANCMMGSRKCTIECQSGGCPEPTSWQPGQTLNTKAIQKTASCTTGRIGTCRIIDTTVVHPSALSQGSGTDAQDNLHYYYVVTAVAGGIESAYSNENVALPNYCGGGTACGSYLRYDPDNEGDVSCDDENSELLDLEGEPTEALASLDEPGESVDEAGAAGLPARIPSHGMVSESEAAASPYRLIGARYASVGGAEGTTPGQGGGSFTPPPVVPRWLFYHTDHLGNSRVIMDINGQVVSKHDFMPFGEERPIAARMSSNTNYFTGHERDRENAPSDDVAGLDYMLARYYSSSLGRFMGVDQHGGNVSLPQSWNRYVYARDNPLLLLDPDGKEARLGSGAGRTLEAIRLSLPPQDRSALSMKTDSAGVARLQIDNSHSSTDLNFKNIQKVINSPGIVEFNVVSSNHKISYNENGAPQSTSLGNESKKGVTLPSEGTKGSGEDAKFSSTQQGVTEVYLDCSLSPANMAPVAAAEVAGHALPGLLGDGATPLGSDGKYSDEIHHQREDPARKDAIKNRSQQ